MENSTEDNPNDKPVTNSQQRKKRSFIIFVKPGHKKVVVQKNYTKMDICRYIWIFAIFVCSVLMAFYIHRPELLILSYIGLAAIIAMVDAAYCAFLGFREAKLDRLRKLNELNQANEPIPLLSIRTTCTPRPEMEITQDK